MILFSFGIASNFIVAQEGGDPAEIAQADAKKNNKGFVPITEDDLLARVFPDDKSSCTMKASLFTVISKKYTDGAVIEEFVSMAVLKPVLESYYTQIRDSGLTQATLANIKEYQNCARSAKAHEDSAKERELSAKHRACVKFADVMLGTLNSIQRRQSASTVIEKYQSNPINMKGTAFGELDNSVEMFIGQLYKIAQKKSYDDAVSLGQGLVASCPA
ncbi:MAG: hypothetical protein ACRBDI_08380 [Alphaproteobacteria bacterium]